jgi:UDP-glucose 4-epimerase
LPRLNSVGVDLMIPILVTGGAGYIGSHTCKALRRAGFDPISYDNLARGNPESVKWGVLEVGDLTDKMRLREAFARHRPAAVIHFAALAYVDESNLNPTLYYQNNVGGTAALLEGMRECGVGKLVFSSSCAVYGTPAVVPIAEESPYAPINPYGATKMICERMLRECAVAFPLSFIALRYFNAAGWSVRELVASVREVTGCEIPIQVGARRPGDPPALIADASRARHQLGWRPQYLDLTSQVRHAWAWRQGNCQGWKRMQARPAPAAVLM